MKDMIRRGTNPGPQPYEPWRGIHLLMNTNTDTDGLTAEVPELAAKGINVIITEVNYHYAFTSHPKLQDQNPITKEHIQALMDACLKHDIRLIPQFQCLGHQSWAKETFPLLVQHPDFDETPGQYSDNEGIYCRSWCPQHPQVNPIIYDLFDELLDVFEADALHVGMDEVFLIASQYCQRCKGNDPAVLFAQAVNDYYTHLVKRRGVEMLMWGDRLLDGFTTGYGEWEAAKNSTHLAIDRIPKDIILCDWHYTKRDDYPSIPLFLQKGFRVWPSGWKEVDATEALIVYAQQFKDGRILGHLCTTWGAVKSGSLAAWPPIQKATSLWRNHSNWMLTSVR